MELFGNQRFSSFGWVLSKIQETWGTKGWVAVWAWENHPKVLLGGLSWVLSRVQIGVLTTFELEEIRCLNPSKSLGGWNLGETPRFLVDTISQPKPRGISSNNGVAPLENTVSPLPWEWFSESSGLQVTMLRALGFWKPFLFPEASWRPIRKPKKWQLLILT